MKDCFNSFSSFIKEKFHEEKVRKIPISAGFECPNKSGELSTEGCIFCDEFSSGPLDYCGESVKEQIESFINRCKDIKYIAYFQSNTNTAAPIDVLKKTFMTALDYEDIVGVFIGTRPDAIRDEVYPLLEELNRKVYLSVDIGLQSIHSKSIDYLNRNHSYETFLETFSRLKERDIDTVVHLILGIPGETEEDMLASIHEMNRLKPRGVKLHMLHVLKNTRLETLYREGKVPIYEKEEYIELAVRMLENLDPEIVVHRLTGERDNEIFIAPEWALRKGDTINHIRNRMRKMKTYQGAALKKV